jgi:hypothetical protein
MPFIPEKQESMPDAGATFPQSKVITWAYRHIWLSNSVDTSYSYKSDQCRKCRNMLIFNK